MAADEALILLAEAILLAGLLMFSARLWSARFDPYPQLVAQLLNSSPVDAELFIALPKPVRVELDRLCQAGSCYSIAPLGAVYGTAWDWLIVYKRKAALAGGGVPPSPYALLAVQVRRVNHAGNDLGPVQGVQVRIMGQTYVTDAGGWVNVTLVKGYTYTVEIVQTGFNNGWGRYSFYRWGDGSTENPRSVYLSDSVQLLTYVWDERLLKVTYTAGGVVRVNGTQVSSGYTTWCRYGVRVALEAVPSAGYYFQKWQRGVNSDTLSDYSTSNPLTVTMDNGYRFHAVFDWYRNLTVQVYRVDKAGASLGGAGGVQVRIGGNSYTADANGRVSLQVTPGTYTIEIVQTSFNSGWGRYTFWRWWDGSTANPRSFTVTTHTTITAYAWDERLLKVTYGSGGFVKVNGTQVSSGYTAWFILNTVVTLEAVPNSGYAFLKWQRGVNSDSLSDYSTSNPITITVDNGYRFNAVFEGLYELRVEVRACNSAGSDTGPAAGIRVRVNGTEYTADSNGIVRLQVRPRTYVIEIVQTGFNNNWGRYTFWKWWDGSTSNPRTFTVTGDTTVTAYAWDERLLKVTYTTGGVVKVNGTQVSSGWSSWYRYGSTVVLQAVPNSGYYFQKWQRGVNSDSLSDYSTSNPIIVTVDNGYRFHAVFDALKWLTVQVYRVDKAGSSLGGAAGIQVRIDGNSYTADSNGVVKVQVVPGTHTVEIVQTSFNSGWGRYTFWRWGDGSTANPRTFTVAADATVTAYAWDERLLKITYTSGGAVKVNGTQVSSGYTTWCRYGSVATLEAVASSGYQFVKWQRGVNSDSLSDYSTSNPLTVTMDNGYRFHAVFGTTYTFTVEVRRVDYAGTDIGPAVAAVVVVNGQSYTTDSSGRVTFTNVAPGASFTVQFNQQTFNSGWGRYTLWKWWDGSTSNPRTFTVTSDATVTMYVYDERLLKVSYGSNGFVRVNGTQVSSGWSSWYRYGSTVVLEAVPNSGYVLQKWQRGVNTDTLSDYDVRLKETVTASGGGGYIVLSRTTTNAFGGYVELTLSFTITPSNPSFGYTYYARIEACSQYLVNEYETRTGSYSRTISWKGVLPCSSSRITFSVYYISYTWGSVSMTGTALRPATNPLLVTMDNGYHYRAEFGTP